MLFRFRAYQASSLGIVDVTRTRRPKAISIQENVPVCEKWRGQVLKEISRKVSKIQDPSLSDYQLRDINDELNKLFKEKWQWEMRIRELGGPNYMRGGGRVLDDEGREIAGGGKGYRYFGRARELPGVKELFEAAKKPREEEGKVRTEVKIRVDADYYGYGNDETADILQHEAMRENESKQSMMDLDETASDEDWEPLPGDSGDAVAWNLPTLDEVEAELINRTRRTLLDKL